MYPLKNIIWGLSQYTCRCTIGIKDKAANFFLGSTSGAPEHQCPDQGESTFSLYHKLPRDDRSEIITQVKSRVSCWVPNFNQF